MSKKFRAEVKTFRTELYCDCGGQFIHNGMTTSTHPPGYSHSCNACTNVTLEDEKYPKIEYEEVAQSNETDEWSGFTPGSMK